jgi:hypothetical protein
MNSSIAASTIAARRSAARMARLDAGAAASPSGPGLPVAASTGAAFLMGFFVILHL